MSILNSGFTDHTNSALIVAANHIARSLSTPPGSGFYPSPDPDLATLRAAIAAFAADMQKGVKPGAAAARASSRAALTDILKRLAIDLEGTTPGDRAKLAHTGYDLRKPRERNHSPLAAPGNVRAMPTGNRGEARLDCRRVKGTLIYEARASQDPSSGSYAACPPSSSKRKLLFKGLERGTDWFFQIRAIGANGPGPWSDPAMMMVV